MDDVYEQPEGPRGGAAVLYGPLGTSGELCDLAGCDPDAAAGGTVGRFGLDP